MKTQQQLETLNGQAYPSSYGYAYPQNSAIRSCVVFDGGNRFIKWIDPTNQVKIIPSCIKEVSEYQWKRLRPDPETVLLEVDGKRYAVGSWHKTWVVNLPFKRTSANWQKFWR